MRVFLSLLLVERSIAALSCRDSDSIAKDWVFALKQPNGFAYSYRDSADQVDEPLRISPFSLNSSTNFAWGTLQPLFEDKNASKFGFVFYNDENPNGTTRSGGAHAKGVLATDGESGFWLVHSVPKYPDLRDDSFAWTASSIYGQSFLCISLGLAALDEVAKQGENVFFRNVMLRDSPRCASTVLIMDPYVFASGWPDALAGKAPHLELLALEDEIPIIPMDNTSVVTFESLAGASFTSFAKTPEWDRDFYADLVQPVTHTRHIHIHTTHHTTNFTSET